jgi:hypothetical protein
MEELEESSLYLITSTLLSQIVISAIMMQIVEEYSIFQQQRLRSTIQLHSFRVVPLITIRLILREEYFGSLIQL